MENEFNQQVNYTEEIKQTSSFSRYLGKVCLWMFVGLIITFGVSFGLSNSTFGLKILSDFWWILLISPIIQIVICLFMGKSIYKQNPTTITVLYFLYAILSGFTFGFLFAYLELTTVAYALGLTSVLFLVMAVLGLTTKINLEKFTSLIFVGFIVLIVLSVVSFFIFSNGLERLIAILGIFLITVLTMIDFQRLKKIYHNSESENRSLTIYGAFSLYLDFITMFIYILRLISSSNRN
jgi:FtsH-binding integral membrane protein